MEGTLRPQGKLMLRVTHTPKAPLSWRLHNTLRWTYFKGWLAFYLGPLLAKLFGFVAVTSRLSLMVHKATGEWVDYGVVSFRQVTDTGVQFIVDAFQNSVEPENMKYHGIGTGAGAEGAGNTALTTEITTAYNPDNTRPTGTTVEGASANIFRTVGTITPDAAVACTEHGIFSQAATGGGVMIDRHTFAVVNLNGSGDSLVATYELTFSSGG